MVARVGFGEKVGRFHKQGLHSVCNALAARIKNRQVGNALLCLLGELKPRLKIGLQFEIGEKQVDVFLGFQKGYRLFGGARRQGLVPLLLEDLLRQEAHLLVILDD